MSMPERIWAGVTIYTGTKDWFPVADRISGENIFVRADLVAANTAELEALRAEVATKDARIAELGAEVKKLKDVADQAIEFADIRVQWINEDLSDDKTRVVDSPSVGAFSPYLHALADYIEDQEGYERESPKEQTP